MTAHDVLVERLVRAGKKAGEEALARVAYEMARRCVFLAKGTPKQGVRWVVQPGEVGPLYGELVALEARTGVDAPHDTLPVSDPAPEAAVQFARACLAVVADVRGPSAKVEFQLAKCAQSEGHKEEYADRLLALTRQKLTKSTYVVIQESRQAALIALGRYAEVANLGEALLKIDRVRPDAAFNRLTALGWLEERDDYQTAIRELRDSLQGVADTEYWSRLLSDEAPWLASRFATDPGQVLDDLRWSPDGSRPAAEGDS